MEGKGAPRYAHMAESFDNAHCLSPFISQHCPACTAASSHRSRGQTLFFFSWAFNLTNRFTPSLPRTPYSCLVPGPCWFGTYEPRFQLPSGPASFLLSCSPSFPLPFFSRDSCLAIPLPRVLVSHSRATLPLMSCTDLYHPSISS
jgi:hypothetical protein